MMCQVTGLQDHFKVSFTKPSNVIVLAYLAMLDHIAEHFLLKGATVVGTYRNKSPQVTMLEKQELKCFLLTLLLLIK